MTAIDTDAETCAACCRTEAEHSAGDAGKRCAEFVHHCADCYDMAFDREYGRWLCSACADEAELAMSREALARIAEALAAPDWNADTLDAIAEAVRGTGREIAER